MVLPDRQGSLDRELLPVAVPSSDKQQWSTYLRILVETYFPNARADRAWHPDTRVARFLPIQKLMLTQCQEQHLIWSVSWLVMTYSSEGGSQWRETRKLLRGGCEIQLHTIGGSHNHTKYSRLGLHGFEVCTKLRGCKLTNGHEFWSSFKDWLMARIFGSLHISHQLLRNNCTYAYLVQLYDVCNLSVVSPELSYVDCVIIHVKYGIFNA